MQDAFDFTHPDEQPSDQIGARSSPAVWSLAETLRVLGDGKVVVATVNRRLSRHLVELHSKHRVGAGDTWWDTPAILPLANWLTELHGAALASGLSTRARLNPLAAHLRWRSIVGSSHALLLDVNAAAKDAMRAWKLAHTWDCLPEPDRGLSEDAHAWRAWSQDYAAGLANDSLVDEATLPGHLMTLMGDGSLNLPDTLVLAGFLASTPELRALTDAFTAAGVRVVTLGEREPTTPRCLCWRDDAEELAAVAYAARERLQLAPEAILGVVVPELDAQRAVVRRAFDRAFFPGQSPAEIDRIGRPYDLSAGVPLIDRPVARAATDALTLAWLGLDRQGVTRLLLSPNLMEARSEAGQRESLERRLRDRRVRHCSLRRVHKELDDYSVLRRALAGLRRRIDEAREQDQATGATRTVWAERFSDVLRAFGWPGQNLSSDEYQAVQAVHGLLDDLQSLDDGETVSARAALDDVLRFARERVFQPETPDLPIRVLGRLESHGQQFDTLWVTGLDSEHWPAQGNATPYLPMDAQRDAGLPEASPEARLALAHIEYRHWCASAPEVVVSCARERDGKPLVPAAVMHDMTESVFAEPDLIGKVYAAVAQETLDDPSGPPTTPDEIVRGGTRLLEDQAVCPFRAFARHRLEIRPLEEPEPGLDARQRGSFLHRALEFFWQETCSQQALLDLDDDTLTSRIKESVAKALAEDKFIDATIARLETVRIIELMSEWLEGVEMARTPFTVEGFEEKVAFEHGGVGIRMTLDRIDRVDGALVVIDYKSGRSDGTASWSEPRIGNPQLPLYALTRDDIEGVAFAQVVRGRCGFKGIAAREDLLTGVDAGDPAQEWASWRHHWRSALDTVASEVAEGLAVALPSDKACQYCDLGGLCRVDSMVSPDEEGEAE